MEWNKLIMLAVVSLGLFIGLSCWDASGTATFRAIETRWLPAMAETLGDTPLGTWKEGKLPRILGERSGPMAEILIKSTLALPYGLLIVLVHNDSRRKVMARLSRRPGSGPGGRGGV
jgi:hypothetical protein